MVVVIVLLVAMVIEMPHILDIRINVFVMGLALILAYTIRNLLLVLAFYYVLPLLFKLSEII